MPALTALCCFLSGDQRDHGHPAPVQSVSFIPAAPPGRAPSLADAGPRARRRLRKGRSRRRLHLSSRRPVPPQRPRRSTRAASTARCPRLAPQRPPWAPRGPLGHLQPRQQRAVLSSLRPSSPLRHRERGHGVSPSSAISSDPGSQERVSRARGSPPQPRGSDAPAPDLSAPAGCSPQGLAPMPVSSPAVASTFRPQALCSFPGCSLSNLTPDTQRCPGAANSDFSSPLRGSGPCAGAPHGAGALLRAA